jgi:hypothetical protein
VTIGCSEIKDSDDVYCKDKVIKYSALKAEFPHWKLDYDSEAKAQLSIIKEK